jgi:glycosyltransferase involved in cell wall biosynthesis
MSGNLLTSIPYRRASQWIGDKFPVARRAYKRTKALFWNLDAAFDRLSRKPLILILVDKPGWAYDTSMRQIKCHLAKKFNIKIRYSGDQLSSSKNYDLLHVCFWGDEGYKSLGFDCERIIKEVSSHRWQDDPLYGPCTPEEFAQRYLSDCDTVICTSRRLREIVEKVFPRVFHAPNGVDIGRFNATKRMRGANLVFGWAGNVDDPVKGFRDFIEPACGDRFKLISAQGKLHYRDMAAFYKKIDILAVSSQHEGEPLPLLEAMASGCFPVCVDVGIVPELIKHKENGYIVRERSVDAFREGFEWCDRNRAKVRTAGLANAGLIARERNWEICAQNFGRVYKETLARASRAMFRNDDVAWDTNLECFRLFCAVFQKYGQTQIHGVTLHGCTNVIHLHNGAEVEYEGFDSIARLDNETIRRLSIGKAIEDRIDIINFLKDSADEVALHGLFHTDYSVMSKEEQDREIGEGLTKIRRLFPRKRIRFFIAPFNRTNPATYQVAAKYGLKVCADEGVHLEQELNDLTIQPKQWYRYHHHRFYPESCFTYYQLSIDKLDAALQRNFRRTKARE